MSRRRGMETNERVHARATTRSHHCTRATAVDSIRSNSTRSNRSTDDDARPSESRTQGTLSNGEILDLIQLAAAFGFEEVENVASGRGVSAIRASVDTTTTATPRSATDAARYVLTGDRSSGYVVTTRARELHASVLNEGETAASSATTNAPSANASAPSSPAKVVGTPNKPHGARASVDGEENAASKETGDVKPKTKTIDIARLTTPIARRSRSSTSNASQTKKKPKAKGRRRTDGEPVEDRLLREWILKQARETARLEDIRRAEMETSKRVLLTPQEIKKNMEAMRVRDQQAAARQEHRRKAAIAEERKMATASVSQHIGTRTRKLTSSLPDFAARQKSYANTAAQNAERLRRELEEERLAKETANSAAAERVPITRRAAGTHRTLEDLNAWNERRVEKLRIAKAKAVDAEIAAATFKPNLDPKSLRLALKKRMSEKKARGVSNGVAASESGSPRVGARETSHPTFTPEINKKSADLASTRRDGQSGASVYERLYSAAKSGVTRYVENATPRRVRASATKTPIEPWGGYGIDDVAEDTDDAASGFISLSEIAAE